MTGGSGGPPGRAVVSPPALAKAVAATGFSPAVRAGDLLFLTGATGGGPDGAMPDDPGEQVRNALGKVATILAEAGGDLSSVVEMTSYHVGLRDHWDAIEIALRAGLGQPLPAWTAVEVAGLRRPGAVIELRLVAHMAGRP